MAPTQRILDDVRAALASVPLLDLHRTSIRTAWDGQAVTLEGEVESIAAKKLALEAVVALPGVSAIVDRLHVAPAQRQGDGEIWHDVTDALRQESAFRECRLRGAVDGRTEAVLQKPDSRRGDIVCVVADGIVTLDGEVPSLSHKRLAGVLAWWVPGSRDVVNGLAVEPDEPDSDAEISDAIRLVLEKDPFVDATQIRVSTEEAVVTLMGLVPTESEREMAGYDAWFVFGVDKVDNRIKVRA